MVERNYGIVGWVSTKSMSACCAKQLLGIATVGQGLVKNFAGLVGMRLVLGIFEAGLFPGKSLPLLSTFVG